MKKLGLIMLFALLIMTFYGCGSNDPVASPTPAATQPANVDDGGDAVQQVIQMGFSIAGEGAFYDQLKKDIEAACAAKGYTFTLLSSPTASQQVSDISELLASGISVLVVGPADVDVLETVLAECETEGVPVINLIDPINGRVSTLVSPDYSLVGQHAAERAIHLFGETGANCLVLKTDYDSFIMQLLSDGFAKKLAENEKLSLVSEQYCGDDGEQAYELAKTELQSTEKAIGFIFAQNAVLAHGALQAIEETGSAAKLVAFAGDMDLVAAVASGQMDAAISIGPEEAANTAVENAGKLLNDPAFVPPPFLQLDVDVITVDNAAEYNSEELLHAQVKTE